MLKQSFKFNRQFWLTMLAAVIIAIFLSLRFWQLGGLPSALNPDEASIGYNAWLLAQTGRDEWGRTWPLVLEAFGDQKVIGYTLMVVPLVKLFGMEDWAIRLPAAAAVLLINWLAGWWFWRRHQPRLAIWVWIISGLQPVWWWYGRVAFEASWALVWLIGVVLLLFPWRQKQISLLRWSLGMLMLWAACFTYNAPLLQLSLIFGLLPYWHGWRNWRRWLPLLLGSGLVWLICVAASLNLAGQKSQITIFGDETISLAYGEYRQHFAGLGQKLVGNKLIYYSGIIAERTIANLRPSFWWGNLGGHPWHAIPGSGYLSWAVYWLGWYGWLWMAAQIITRRGEEKNRQWLGLLICLSVIGLLPAVITVNSPHATRSLLFLWTWGMAAGVGVNHLASLPKQKIWQQVVAAGILILILLPAVKYLSLMFLTYQNSPILQAGLRPGLQQALTTELPPISQDHTYAVIDGRGFDYILVAWYTKMPPEDFFATVKKQLPDKINFKYGERVGSFHFLGQSIDRRDQSWWLEYDYDQVRWIWKQ